MDPVTILVWLVVAVVALSLLGGLALAAVLGKLTVCGSRELRREANALAAELRRKGVVVI